MSKISALDEFQPGLEISARAKTQPGLKFYHLIASAGKSYL